MDHYNYINKPFDLNVVHEQLNSCQFISVSVEDKTMDQLGMEIVPPLPINESSTPFMFQHSSIFKSLSLEAALMTIAEERTKAIYRVYYTVSHLESRNIVINTLMSLINGTFETEDLIALKLDDLGFTNVSKIVHFMRLLLIMNVWSDREYNEVEILQNIIEKNVLGLLSHIIAALAEHFRPAYNYAISIPVQVSIFILLVKQKINQIINYRWHNLAYIFILLNTNNNIKFRELV